MVCASIVYHNNLVIVLGEGLVNYAADSPAYIPFAIIGSGNNTHFHITALPFSLEMPLFVWQLICYDTVAVHTYIPFEYRFTVYFSYNCL